MMSSFGGVHNMLNAFLTSHILMSISMSLSTSTAERKVIYNIGAEHCPCLKFCNEKFRTINYTKTDDKKNNQFVSDDQTNDQFIFDDQTNDQFVFDNQTNDQFVSDDQTNDQFVFDDQANDQFVPDDQKNNQSVSDYQKNDQFVSDEENDSICEDVYTPQKHDFSRQDTLSVLCCGKCSCDDDCWKTANCCPDKDNVHDKPTLMCKSPVVKLLPNESPGKIGYFVVNSCPRTEKNITLISKCIAEVKTEFEDFEEFEDYIWVYDLKEGLSYQNKYCALCHHIDHFIQWQLNFKCTYIPPSKNLENSLLSNNCRLKLEAPVNVSTEICLVPDYTFCNESGIWGIYNAEIERACYSYQSIYFAQVLMRRGLYVYKSFRNVFCYYCNKDHSSPTEPVCNISADVEKEADYEFTSLIDFTDYRRTDNDQDKRLSSQCKKNEVMDKILGFCRVLICPFGTKLSQGVCEPIFDTTLRLTVRIQFGLNVLWSKNNYSINDDDKTLKGLGDMIHNAITESPDHYSHSPCKYANCVERLIMLSNVSVNDLQNMNGVTNETVSISEQVTNSAPAFVYLSDIFTSGSCQLEEIYNETSRLSDKHVLVSVGGETVMYLYMYLFNEKGQHFHKNKQIKYHGIECNYGPALTIKDKICSKVGLRYSEFSKYVTASNKAILESVFTENQTQTDEVVDICLDDYYNALLSFNIVTQSSTSTTVTLYSVSAFSVFSSFLICMHIVRF